MLLKQYIVLVTFILQQSIVYAVTIENIVAALEVFTTNANKLNDVIDGVNAVNGATTEPSVRHITSTDISLPSLI